VKNFRAHAIGIFLAACVCTSGSCGPDLTNYQLTFDEEFTALSISNSKTNDGSRWYTEAKACCMSTSDGALDYLWPNWPPGPPAAGTVSPFSLVGRTGPGLNIRLSIQTPTSGTYAGKPVWIGGLIASVARDGGGFSQQYGYFEMKAKLPTSPSPGVWPAFWMLPVSGCGEIDIMGTYGAFPSQYNITLHDWCLKTVLFQATIGTSTGPDLTTTYHTYGLLWTEQTLTFYFDGAQIGSTPTPAVMKQPYFILVDLGMGGGWPTDQTPNPSDMQVQYVKAYQNKSSLP
jgi:hypothetical protein